LAARAAGVGEVDVGVVPAIEERTRVEVFRPAGSKAVDGT
jgi:hypothetical protein